MASKCQITDEGSEVQMAPLIDCVFLLLTFFLCTATMKKAHKELELELADSAAAITTKSKADTIIIELGKDGKIYMEGEPLTQRMLHKKLREAKQASPNRRVRIDGDRRAAFQHLTHLIDLLQFEGLNNVGLRARDEF